MPSSARRLQQRRFPVRICLGSAAGFPLMARRMVTNFSRAGFPSYETIDEDGQAKPCVFGQPWVNPDTLATLHKHGNRRTGPKGEPIVDGALVKRPLR
jgi:hypothetical protein